MTQEMAHQLGRALEEIARATGSTAHFYSTLNMTDGQHGCDIQGFSREFLPIIELTGTVQRANLPRPNVQVQIVH